MSKIELYHSPSGIAFAGKSLQIAACAPSELVIGEGSLRLTATLADACIELSMLNKGSVEQDGIKYSIFSAIIPASFVNTTGVLSYFISFENETVLSCQCTVVAVPDIPELFISEISVRPKGTTCSAFLELTNTTSEPIDLYNYKIAIYDGYDPLKAVSIAINPISEAEGEHILPPKSTVAVRYCSPKQKAPIREQYMTKEGFCEACNADYFYVPNYEPISADKIELISPEICEMLPSGEWTMKHGCAALPMKMRPYTVSIIRKDATPENAVYSVYLNEVAMEHDSRVKHSALWGIDLNNPTKAKNVRRHIAPTPGYLDQSQAIPDFTDILPPVIIPDTETSYAYYKDGNVTLTYTVIDKKVTDTGIYYLDPTSTPIKLYASRTEKNNVYSVTVPENVIKRLKKLNFYYFAFDSIRESCLGSADNAFTVSLYDNEGPELLSAIPSKEYCFEMDEDEVVEIKGRYFDISGINASKCILCIDKKNVSRAVKWTENGFSCRVKNLKKGAHKFELALFDNLGNHSYTAYNFFVSDGKELNHYFGEFHSHSTDSDGAAPSRYAIEFARDTGGVDFFAVTDHSNDMGEAEYPVQVRVANELNDPGKFVALYGWEMTWGGHNGTWGHMNVLNTEWIQRYPIGCSMPDLFADLEADPDAVAMFNHPGYKWGNFCEFSHINDAIKEKMCLAEVKGPIQLHEYTLALKKGWKVSPAFNGDDHNDQWTLNVPNTTFLLAPALTRENIIEAIRKRRSYSASDKSIKLIYKVNGEWLGSTLVNPLSLDFEISVTTENPCGIGEVSIVAENGIKVATVNAGIKQSLSWHPTLPVEYDYYYVLITNTSGITVSAPVWIEEDESIEITELDVASSLDEAKPYNIHVGLKNNTSAAITGARLDFYISDEQGFDLVTACPYSTVYVSKITAGNTADVRVNVSTVNGKRRLTVVAHAIARSEGKKTLKADSRFTLISPVIITSVMPLSSDITLEDGTTVKNPFPYLTLYNTTCNPVSLSGYSLRAWVSAGSNPGENSTFQLPNITLDPFKSLVVWCGKAKNPLTVEDFNAKYGSGLEENISIIRTEKKIIPATSVESFKIDLFNAFGVLSRVTNNLGFAIRNPELIADEEKLYRFSPSTVATSPYYAQGVDVIPGTVYDEQKPRIVTARTTTNSKGLASSYEKKAERATTTKKRGFAKALGAVAIGGAALAAVAGATAVICRTLKAPRSPESTPLDDALKLTKATATAFSVTTTVSREKGKKTTTKESTKVTLKAKPPKTPKPPKVKASVKIKKPKTAVTKKRKAKKPMTAAQIIKKSKKTGVLQPTPITPATPTASADV